MERPIYITKIHSAFSVEEAENFDYAGESHDFWVMVFIERGTAGITAGSRVFTCLPGTLVFHKPNEFHRIWNVGQGAMQFTIISFSVQGAYAEKLRGRVISPEGELAQQLKLLQRQIADNQGENNCTSRNDRGPSYLHQLLETEFQPQGEEQENNSNL